VASAFSRASSWSGTALELPDAMDSSMPSAMLEQEAQMFGLRDRAFPFSDIGSPQHRQMREFMCLGKAQPQRLN
jgi:hypothetical protein